MRKLLVGSLVLFACFVLMSCKQAPNEEIVEDEEATYDIYDFYFINRAPAATEKHPLDKLIKIYYSTKSVAIDVGNHELYEIPRFATNGVTILKIH